MAGPLKLARDVAASSGLMPGCMRAWNLLFVKEITTAESAMDTITGVTDNWNLSEL
jgi:hypothetical protein